MAAGLHFFTYIFSVTDLYGKSGIELSSPDGFFGFLYSDIRWSLFQTQDNAKMASDDNECVASLTQNPVTSQGQVTYCARHPEAN